MEFEPILMSESKDYQDHYNISFSENIYGIKFEVFKNEPTTSDRNKGRVVIGQISLSN